MNSRTIDMRVAAVALTLLISLLAASTALAKSYSATGSAKGDKSTTIEVVLDAKAKKGKLKSASAITDVFMRNAAYECSATGESGRTDYAHNGTWERPVKIAKNGKFSDVYELKAGKYVVERYTLKGKVSGKGKNLVVTGTFKAEKGAGGIQFNNCSTGDVPFTAKAKL